MVLRRIEHFEQRRRRIAAPVGAQLVDLVEQDHRIHRAGIAQRAHQPAGQRADIGAPMAADLGLVPHAAERHPDELPAGGPGDRLANRGLAGSRRADQRQNGARPAIVGETALGAQLADRQILGDALLDVVEAGVVGVEHLPRVLRVEALLGSLRPRHGEQPVEIGPDHRRFGVGVAHPLESRQLTLGLLLHRLGHPGRRNLLPIFLGNRRLVLAELLANRVHLPAQEILALLFLRARLHVVANALADAQLRQPLLLEAQRQRQPLDDVERFEEFQLLGDVQIRRVAGRIRQRAGIGDRADERADAAIVAAQLENFLDDGAILALEFARQGRRRRARPDARRRRRGGRRPGRCGPRRARRGGAPRATRPAPAEARRAPTPRATTPTLA